jgi:hypothetical protein
MPAAACTLDVANAIAVRCTTADDSVATACAAGFYLTADDTCLGMDAAVREHMTYLVHSVLTLAHHCLAFAACQSVANALAVVCTALGNNSVAVACEAGYYPSSAGTCAGAYHTLLLLWM